MSLFKKKLTESEAGAMYVASVFKAAVSSWAQISEFLKDADSSLAEAIGRAICPEGYFALALLAQNIGGAVYYSPAFSTRRTLAHRLSSWALLSVITDHLDEFSHLGKAEVLAHYRRYEAFGLQASTADKDPITPIANALFVDTFKDDIGPFMIDGTDEVNPLISTIFNDFFLLSATNTFKALRHVTENFKLVEVPFPPA